VGDVRIGGVIDEENQIGTAAAAQPDSVAMPQRPFGDLLVVDERAASRSSIPQHEPPVVLSHDLGMLSRHIGAGRPQMAIALAADAEHRLVDDDGPPAE
jgi:hypothetical protein